MCNPNSGILDLRAGVPALAPPRLADWPQTAGAAGRLRNVVLELMTRFLAWRAQKATLRLLSSLDAATRRDLGLTDIEAIVFGDPRDQMRGYEVNWWRKG